MAGPSNPAQEVVRFEEAFGGGARAILGVAGLVPLLAPWEFLVRPGITAFDTVTLLPWLVSAGALAAGLPLLGVALLGFLRTVTIIPGDGLLSERERGPFRLTWTRSQALEWVAGIGVDPEAWSGEPVASWVVARFKNRTRPWRPTRRAAREVALAVARDVASRSRLPLST
ncbi:hypothetical protein [Methylobacterium sp. CM6257]